MNIFKAHFIHPYTELPLIIYFNKSDGHVTFAKDDEMIKFLLKLEKRLLQDRQFIKTVTEPANICDTQYSVTTFDEVFDLLEQLGVNKEVLKFKQIQVH